MTNVKSLRGHFKHQIYIRTTSLLLLSPSPSLSSPSSSSSSSSSLWLLSTHNADYFSFLKKWNKSMPNFKRGTIRGKVKGIKMRRGAGKGVGLKTFGKEIIQILCFVFSNIILNILSISLQCLSLIISGT